jgi:SAM-dependent methyltransferase
VPERIRCNLCRSDNAKPIFRLCDYRLRVDDVEWTAVRCRNCGLGYLNPRPTAEEVARYYPSEYFGERAAHGARYQRFARYLPNTGRRLLDIGTARGDFLALMRDRGWTVTGIEPFADAGNPYQLEIHKQHFPDECDLPDESYDVVTAWAVFEHLHDPARAFEECSRLLRPGGLLIVQVPNLRSIHSRWALQEDVPRHLYFFDESTLRAYGARNGLVLDEVVHTTDLFGGSGRGVLRLALVRATGRSIDDFFEIYRTGRWMRFRRWPLLAAAWTAASAVERMVLADRVIRTLRVSGQVVALFSKAGSPRSDAARASAPLRESRDPAGVIG